MNITIEEQEAYIRRLESENRLLKVKLAYAEKQTTSRGPILMAYGNKEIELHHSRKQLANIACGWAMALGMGL